MTSSNDARQYPTSAELENAIRLHRERIKMLLSEAKDRKSSELDTIPGTPINKSAA